jgi:hypothetical protein
MNLIFYRQRNEVLYHPSDSCHYNFCLLPLGGIKQQSRTNSQSAVGEHATNIPKVGYTCCRYIEKEETTVKPPFKKCLEDKVFVP